MQKEASRSLNNSTLADIRHFSSARNQHKNGAGGAQRVVYERAEIRGPAGIYYRVFLGYFEVLGLYLMVWDGILMIWNGLDKI